MAVNRTFLSFWMLLVSLVCFTFAEVSHVLSRLQGGIRQPLPEYSSEAPLSTYETSAYEKEHPYRVFDVDRIGVALYFLTIVYAVFFILSLFRFRAVTRFLTLWSAQKLLYTSVMIHMLVRTGGFGLLGFFTLSADGRLWYPFQAMLFTLPEYVSISTFILVFFTWFESVIFSHSQCFITSRSEFRKYTRIIFFATSFAVYLLVCVLYLMICTDQHSFQDFVSMLIEWSCAILNAALVIVIIIVALYIRFIKLAGYTLVSPIAKELVNKVTYAFTLWCLGRLVRACVFALSIAYRWQQTMASNTLSMAIVSILVVTELAPALFLLDWTLICVLLIGEEVAEAHTQDNPTYLTTDSSGDFSSGGVQFAGLSYQDGALTEPLVPSRYRDAYIDVARIKLPRELYAHTVAAPSFSAPHAQPLSVPTLQGPQVLYDSGIWCTATGVTDLPLPGAEPSHAGGSGLSKVLVKRYRLEGLGESSVRELAHEVIERCSQADGKGHVTQVHGIAVNNNTVYIVSKFHPRRSVFDLLQQTSRDLAPTAIVRLSYQIALAMEGLHGRGFVHAHLKSRNVLLDEALNAKVCDQGVRYLKTYAEVMYGERFHTAWTAPEILLGFPPSKASDVYSFGVICWELLYRQQPFKDRVVTQLTVTVGQQGERLPLPTQADLKAAQEQAAREGRPNSVIPPAFVLLVARCFLAPDLRPSFSDILLSLQRISRELGVEMPATDSVG